MEAKWSIMKDERNADAVFIKREQARGFYVNPVKFPWLFPIEEEKKFFES